MLRRLKIAREIAPEPEQLFMERYDRILGWSMQLTSYDRELAEDLLHDLFIQFVLSGPDPADIANLDGYLYICLRNLHIAQQRRANRNRLVQLSIVEYDSAAIGLNAVDFRDQLAAHDELRKVCQYACSRKESAKVASVLILRFFHGYYPDEITQVAGSPRSAIDKWLNLARGEARASLDKDSKLSFITPQTEPPANQNSEQHRPDDLLDELRETIFGSRQGIHPQIRLLYSPGELSPVECSQLAHIVSCANCLDGVNKLLGLTLLKDRQATETLSRDKNKKDDSDKGGGSGGSGGTGGGMNDALLGKLRRKVMDTFAHRPQELCVAVNGYALGSHRVTAERSELNLMVERAEDIDFVEVYTEQKIRLLLHNIEDQPPTGPGERTAIVKLSDDRMLELSLRFTSPSPTIQVVYLDPMFNLDSVAEEAFTAEAQRRGDDRTADLSGPPAVAGGDFPAKNRNKDIHTSLLGLDGEIAEHKGIFGRFVQNLTSLSFWLRPSTIAVAVSCILVASVLYLSVAPTSRMLATAPEVLKKATEAEVALATRTDLVVHRTFNLEERNAVSGEVRSRKRIDIWQSGERKAESKRLYDESGRLLAGEFETEEGTTLYVRTGGVQDSNNRGTNPRDAETPRSVPPAVAGGALDLAQNPSAAWQLSPSAIDFDRLVAATNTQLTDGGDRYLISYFAEDQARVGLVKASLTINKSDMRPVEQTLTVRRALSVLPAPTAGALQRGPSANQDDLTEYHFIETTFEQRAPDTVPPSVFEPDAELLVPEVAVVRQEAVPTEEEETAPPATAGGTDSASAIATADLEVEVLRLLNSVGADIDDQTDVVRTSDGRLQITGFVDTNEKKAEILKALAPVRNNPAVVIRIETYAEAAKRQKQAAPGQITIESVQVEKSRIAVFDEVARHIGSTDEEAVRRFSAGVLNRSRAVMATAGTLKKLAGRFSRDDLKSMTPEARAKWLGVIRGHARSVESEARRLRQDIQAVFGGTGSAAGDGDIGIDTDDELQQAANRLFASAAANDRVIRSAFTISADGSSAAGVKNAGFVRQLINVERLAASLQRAK